MALRQATEEDLPRRQRARDRPAQEGDGELAPVDVALHDHGLPKRLDELGDAITQAARLVHDRVARDAGGPILPLGLYDDREGDLGEAVRAVDAHGVGYAHAGARQDLCRLDLVEAVAERVVRAASEGETEPVEEPRRVHLEAAVATERLAEVEDHARAVIADRGEHLARMEDGAVRDADAGHASEGGQDARRHGGHAVGARDGDVEAIRLAAQWWLVEQLLLIAIGEEQDSGFSAHRSLILQRSIVHRARGNTGRFEIHAPAGGGPAPAGSPRGLATSRESGAERRRTRTPDVLKT